MEEELTDVAGCSGPEDRVIEKVHHKHKEAIRYISPPDAVRDVSNQQLHLMQRRLNTRPIKTDHFLVAEAQKLQKCETVPEDDTLHFYPLRHACKAGLYQIDRISFFGSLHVSLTWESHVAAIGTRRLGIKSRSCKFSP